MKRALLVLLVLISLGLCGICVVQWQREFRLRANIAALFAAAGRRSPLIARG